MHSVPSNSSSRGNNWRLHAAIWVSVMPWQGLLASPHQVARRSSLTAGTARQQAVVHESAVARIELFAMQLTGSAASYHNTDALVRHVSFVTGFSACGHKAAVVVTWHSYCCGVHKLMLAQLHTMEYASSILQVGALERLADHRGL